MRLLAHNSQATVKKALSRTAKTEKAIIVNTFESFVPKTSLSKAKFYGQNLRLNAAKRVHFFVAPDRT